MYFFSLSLLFLFPVHVLCTGEHGGGRVVRYCSHLRGALCRQGQGQEEEACSGAGLCRTATLLLRSSTVLSPFVLFRARLALLLVLTFSLSLSPSLSLSLPLSPRSLPVRVHV